MSAESDLMAAEARAKLANLQALGNERFAHEEARVSKAPGAILAPEFPLNVLPPAMRRYVAEAAASLGAPPEMIAVPMLGFTGSTIGSRLYLLLKDPSWAEYATLILTIVAPPASVKTPSLNFARWPLDALQNDAERVYRQQKADYEARLDAWREGKDQTRGEKPQRPRMRDYFSTNLTLEALVDMLDRAPGVAIVKDEILGWVLSMDQYRAKGSDRQEFLSLWSATTIKVDRKGAEPIYRRFPVACVVGGIQPDMVPGLHTAHRERDGFVERILPIVPDCQPRPWTDDTVDAARYADVADLFRALDTLPEAREADDSAGGRVGIPVRLSNEAKARWVAWYNDNVTLTASAAGLTAGFYGKLPAHVARLALILHALWNPDDPRRLLSGERMEDAIELGEFFRAHMHRFLSLLEATPPPRHAGTPARIIRILRTSAGESTEGWVNRSTILDRLRNVAANDVTLALDALREAGTVECRSVSTATKPIEQWRIVPRVAPGENSDYSDYSHPTGENPNNPNNPNGGQERFPRLGDPPENGHATVPAEDEALWAALWPGESGVI